MEILNPMSRMMKSNCEITVMIPAYNEKNLLVRAVKSVGEQTYRPLTILVMDDSTNGDLLDYPEIEEFQKKYGVKITYIKNQKNLGFYRNYRDGLKHVGTKYFVFLPHDDVYVDYEFFERAIKSLESSAQVFCYVANSTQEENNKPMMKMSELTTHVVPSMVFLKRIFENYHTNHSAIVIDFEKLLQLNYLEKLISDKELSRYELSADEGFVFLYVIAQVSDFLVDPKSVVIRGFNPTSWSRSKYWQINLNACMFLTYLMFLVKSPKLKKTIQVEVYRNLLKRYPLSQFNIKFFYKIRPHRFKGIYMMSFMIGFSQRLKRKILHELNI